MKIQLNGEQVDLDKVDRSVLLERLEKRRIALEAEMLESYYGASYGFDGRVVDPYQGLEGWQVIDGKDQVEFKGPQDLISLETMRNICRTLAFDNSFAINGHTNLRNFIVGTGFTYRLFDPRNLKRSGPLIEKTLDMWEAWVEDQCWWEAELDFVTRGDRDGEGFLRWFIEDDEPVFRWVEPDHVVDPAGHFKFGIIHPENDEQKIVGYVIDGQPVEAHEVLHYKMNVDMNVHRGVPSFWPARGYLIRADKVIKNMSKMAELQAAIAVIREMPAGARGTSTTTWLDGQADKTATDPETGNTVAQKKYQSGSILTAPAGQKYHFPVAGIEAGKLTQVVDANLRAAGAAVSMAEFIFSMNAANSNYASLLAAETPTQRSFEVRQRRLAKVLSQGFGTWLQIMVSLGRLKPEVLSLRRDVKGPSIKSRNEFQETRGREIRHRNGILSARTWATLEGLDYDKELENNQKDDIVIPPSAKNFEDEGDDGEASDPSRGETGKPGRGMDPEDESLAG